jgi:predicted DNA-binding transcriptional regulator YafY
MKKFNRQYKKLAWRIKRIDELISSGECISASKVAQELEVAPRTIQRDLDFIKYDLEAPLIYDTKMKRWVYTEPNYSIPDIHMTKSEYTAILLVKKLVQQYTAVPIQEDIDSILKKITERLSEKRVAELESANNSEPISFSFRNANNLNKEIYKQLLLAIHENQTLKITYFTQSTGIEKTREVDPYLIHNWYLIAFDHDKEKILDFHIGRIRDIKETENKFQIKSDFDKEKYLSQGFNMFKGEGNKYGVEIEISSQISRWIKEQKPLHTSQVIKEVDDGKIVLKLELEELQAVKRFVLQFGSQVKVLEPVELRKLIKNEIIKLCSLYGVNISDQNEES